MSKRPTPAFASGGSFQACKHYQLISIAGGTWSTDAHPTQSVAIDHLDSSSSEEEHEEDQPQKTVESGTQQPNSKNKKKKTNTKPQQKAPLQPAAGKKNINRLTRTTTSALENSKQKKLIPSSTAPPRQEEAGSIQSKQAHSLKNLSIPPSEQLGKLPVNSDSTPITSPSNSTTTSVITSPSTTDFGDQEELDQPVPPAENSYTHQNLRPSLHSTQSQSHSSSLYPTPIITSNAHSSIPSPLPSASPTPTHQTHLLVRSESFSKGQPESVAISQFGADHTPGKKWQTILTRVFWSLIMVSGFISKSFFFDPSYIHSSITEWISLPSFDGFRTCVLDHPSLHHPTTRLQRSHQSLSSRL